jgi:hypothetical protein
MTLHSPCRDFVYRDLGVFGFWAICINVLAMTKKYLYKSTADPPTCQFYESTSFNASDIIDSPSIPTMSAKRALVIAGSDSSGGAYVPSMLAYLTELTLTSI